jgi:hypothetical protein
MTPGETFVDLFGTPPLGFYRTITLGVRINRAPASRKRDPLKVEGLQEPEAWQEGIGLQDCEYEEYQEDRILERVAYSAIGNRFHLVLGEPGAGKTTLLTEWFKRLGHMLPEPKLGSTVPALVRLRRVPAETWGITDEDKFADLLWDLARSERALLQSNSVLPYSSDLGRRFTPLWMLDGLDELTVHPYDETLFQTLANLPGVKIVSSRTAVYQSLRKLADTYKAEEYQIIGLSQIAQKEFLYQAMSDQLAAETLFASIKQNNQISRLAANPLMLTLMAQVSETATRIDLDHIPSRATFYELAVNEMWHRKVRNDRAAFALKAQRDLYLTGAAEEMGLASLRSAFAVEDENLERGLRSSGLIQVDEVTNEFEFIHLTFQEYYLAKSLSHESLKSVLQKYWADPRYEETLGLLTSIIFCEERFVEIEEAMRWLIEWGEQVHRDKPEILWELRRSPLRIVLHVLARSAIPLESAQQLQSLVEFLRDRRISRASVSCKVVIAKDSLTPSVVQALLARDENDEVREIIAKNPSTPPLLLAQLAHDSNLNIRKKVFSNQNFPTELFGVLAQEDKDIRALVAQDLRTPAPVLDRLARDEDEKVREAVAGNSTASSSTLWELAVRKDTPDVLRCMASNKSAPVEILSILAKPLEEDAHWDAGTRRKVAQNEGTPLPLLLTLSGDRIAFVRAGVLLNKKAPLYLRAEIAKEIMNLPKDDSVRYALWDIVEDSVTPSSLLVQLLDSHDAGLCDRIAENPSLPPTLLAELVRTRPSLASGVARNRRTPLPFLMQLSFSEEANVRFGVALNPATPAHILARLFGDSAVEVRRGVAGNFNTPPSLLAQLATEEDVHVRIGVAGNPSTPSDSLPEVLYKHTFPLDKLDADSEELLAELYLNPNLPLEFLAQAAARGEDFVIGQLAPRNPSILLEDLKH